MTIAAGLHPDHHEGRGAGAGHKGAPVLFFATVFPELLPAVAQGAIVMLKQAG